MGVRFFAGLAWLSSDQSSRHLLNRRARPLPPQPAPAALVHAGRRWPPACSCCACCPRRSLSRRARPAAPDIHLGERVAEDAPAAPIPAAPDIHLGEHAAEDGRWAGWSGRRDGRGLRRVLRCLRHAHDFTGGRCTPRPCLRRALRCLRALALGFGGADGGALWMTARCAPAGDDDGAVRWPQRVGGVEALSVGMRCARCRRDEQRKGGKITIVEKDVVVPANPTNQTKPYLARFS